MRRRRSSGAHWLRASAAAVLFAGIGAAVPAGASAIRPRAAAAPNSVTRCYSVGNAGSNAGSVAFALSRCTTASEPNVHGSGTLVLYIHATAQIVWAAPFEGGTTSHPATWMGTFTTHVVQQPDDSEPAAGSCASGETEVDVVGTITRSEAGAQPSRRVHGTWRMEICGPPTALEPGTAFRVRMASA